jgi:DNA-binding phage protein
MYRTQDFNEHLSEQLKSAKYRKEYLQQLINPFDGEEGLSLMGALKDIISTMGVTEFAKLCKMERSSVSRLLSQDTTPKVDTLNRMLSPFKFKIRLELEEVA